MTRLLFALLGCLVLAGCLGTPGTAPTTGSAEAPSETSTVSPAPASESGTLSFGYVVRTASLPDAVGHVYVDFSVYLAERPGDIHACTDGAPLLDNQFDPSPTPLPTPAGRCEQFDVSRVDLATLDGQQTLGRFTADASAAGAHTLVVHDVSVVLENGTTVSSVYDTDFRAVTEESAPSGTYGVEINVTDYEGSGRDLPWRFGIDAHRYEAS